ncbi:hypothetical protein ABK040_015759 [Willaertia magna]
MKETLKKIPLLKEKGGPRDGDEAWEKRLKEEYAALIQYVKMTKENDSTWFSITSNKSGTNQTIHFHPLWSRNVPHFGIAHALALGLSPWLASEVPDLVSKNLIQPKESESSNNTTTSTQQ